MRYIKTLKHRLPGALSSCEERETESARARETLLGDNVHDGIPLPPSRSLALALSLPPSLSLPPALSPSLSLSLSQSLSLNLSLSISLSPSLRVSVSAAAKHALGPLRPIGAPA